MGSFKPTTPAQREHVIKDRDAKSRTVKKTQEKTNVKPDVDVNTRTDIMGDEGPIAKSNPHNQS